MGLTDQELARLRVRWRDLAELALDATLAGARPSQLEKLKRDAHDAMNWSSALPVYHDAFVLFALARLAAAFAKCPVSQVELRRPSLVALAELVLKMLGAEPAPPRLPFRADIDG